MCSSCWLVIFFSSQRLRTAKTSIFFVKKKRKSTSNWSPPTLIWFFFFMTARVFSQLYGFVFSVDIFSVLANLPNFLYWLLYSKKIITYTLFSSSSRLNALATPSARQFRIAHTKTHLSFSPSILYIRSLHTKLHFYFQPS